MLDQGMVQDEQVREARVLFHESESMRKPSLVATAWFFGNGEHYPSHGPVCPVFVEV
jgi:hypothetical protein